MDLNRPSVVVWTHYEWQCQRAADGSLRLFHRTELYAEEAIEDRTSAVTGLPEAWLVAVTRLTVTLSELVRDRRRSDLAEAPGRGQDAKPAA